MGFRPPIDLSEIVQDYDLFGVRRPRGSPSPLVSVPAWEPGPPPDQPLRCGPAEELWASSCLELLPFRPVIWDVNGYYAELGVDSRATRRQLMRAYNALDGQRSERLTYVLRQLLDTDVRRDYDAALPGEPFIDRYVEEEMRKRAAAESGRRASHGEHVSAEEILDDWGYVLLNDDESTELERLDSPPETDEDRPYQESWGYSYYLWKTWDLDTPQLRAWQSLLVKELSARGCSVRFAVGMTAHTEGGFELYEEDGDFIFFLEIAFTPTEEMAAEAVHWYLDRTESN